MHAGCCNDKCKELASTQTDCVAAEDLTKADAGCTGDDAEGDCSCQWVYTGERSTAANCTSEGEGDDIVWDCSAASGFETEGECQDVSELVAEIIGVIGAVTGAVRAGLGAALVPTPPRATPTRLLAAFTFSVRLNLSEGRHSDPPLST